MTGKPGMLTNSHKYFGTDFVIIGDGSSLPILGIGESCIKQKNTTLPLRDVLLVPDLKKKNCSL